MGEREPGGAVDREAVGLATAAASLHRAEKGRVRSARVPEGGGPVAVAAGEEEGAADGGGERVCGAGDGNINAAV